MCVCVGCLNTVQWHIFICFAFLSYQVSRGTSSGLHTSAPIELVGATVWIENRLEIGCYLGRRTATTTSEYMHVNRIDQIYELVRSRREIDNIAFFSEIGTRNRALNISHQNISVTSTNTDAMGTILWIHWKDRLHNIRGKYRNTHNTSEARTNANPCLFIISKAFAEFWNISSKCV